MHRNIEDMRAMRYRFPFTVPSISRAQGYAVAFGDPKEFLNRPWSAMRFSDLRQKKNRIRFLRLFMQRLDSGSNNKIEGEREKWDLNFRNLQKILNFLIFTDLIAWWKMQRGLCDRFKWLCFDRNATDTSFRYVYIHYSHAWRIAILKQTKFIHRACF